MEKLREYLQALENIKDILDDMPTLNYDTEIEEFYENTYNEVEKHYNIILQRLKNKESEVLKICK